MPIKITTEKLNIVYELIGRFNLKQEQRDLWIKFLYFIDEQSANQLKELLSEKPELFLDLTKNLEDKITAVYNKDLELLRRIIQDEGQHSVFVAENK